MKSFFTYLIGGIFLFALGFVYSQREVSASELKPEMMEIHGHDDLLKTYASYNRWANERLVEWISGASEEQFYREVESSFPSLEKTLIHLWNAEFGWLNTLREEPWGTPPGVDFEGSPEELMEGFIEGSKDFEEFVLNMTADDIEGERMLGRNGNAVGVDGIALHVFNHATYHRGQLITIGRQVGLTDPPRTDYIFYINQ